MEDTAMWSSADSDYFDDLDAEIEEMILIQFE
jgi:hypothetical protein